MGISTVVGTVGGGNKPAAVLYDNTTGFAFGPVFDSMDDADDFVEWFRTDEFRGTCQRLELTPLPIGGDGDDPREWADPDLEKLFQAWKAAHRDE